MRKILIFVSILMLFGALVPHLTKAQASPPFIKFQATDGQCNTQQGPDVIISPDGGWSDWITDGNGFETNCYHFYISDGWKEYGKDYQIGVQVADQCYSGTAKNIGIAQYSPWASDTINGLIYTGSNWALHGIAHEDPDCLRIIINTRPLPGGVVLNYFKFGMQLSEKGDSLPCGQDHQGPIVMAGINTQSDWVWAKDEDNNYLSDTPDCARVFMDASEPISGGGGGGGTLGQESTGYLRINSVLNGDGAVNTSSNLATNSLHLIGYGEGGTWERRIKRCIDPDDSSYRFTVRGYYNQALVQTTPPSSPLSPPLYHYPNSGHPDPLPNYQPEYIIDSVLYNINGPYPLTEVGRGVYEDPDCLERGLYEPATYKFDFTLPLTGLAAGKHTIRVTAYDESTEQIIYSDPVDFYAVSSVSTGFDLIIQPYQEILETGSTSFLVSVNCTGGFAGPVTNFRFAAGGNPFNANVNFAMPASINCGGSGLVTVNSSLGSAPLSEPYAPFTTPTFTIEGDGVGIGTKNAVSSLRIYALPKITNYSATPNSGAAPLVSTLDWTSQHTLGCAATDDWSGSKNVSGSESTGSLTRISPAYKFGLTCSGALGSSDSKSVTVTVSSALGSIHVNYSVDGVVKETSDMDVNYSISGPTPVPWATRTIATTHTGRAAGTYVFQITTAPSGYTLAGVSPVSLVLSANETKTFTVQLLSNLSCPANNQLTVTPSTVQAGDSALVNIPSGYSGGTISSSDPTIASVRQQGSSFYLDTYKGGSVVISGSGWNASGKACNVSSTTFNVEDFSVIVSPPLTQAKQGDSVSSIVITVGGGNWSGSPVTLSVPQIVVSKPGDPDNGKSITLTTPAKICRTSNLSLCSTTGLSLTPGQDSVVLIFTTAVGAKPTDYLITATGNFNNGHQVSGTAYLQITSAGSGLIPPANATATVPSCDVVSVSFTNWLDTDHSSEAPEGYHIYRSDVGAPYSWQQVMVITGGSPPTTKSDGSISYDWRYVEDHGPFVAAQYYYAVTAYNGGSETAKTIANPAPIAKPPGCVVATPNLGQSAKQITKVGSVSNVPGVNSVCAGATSAVTANGGKLVEGATLTFRIDICNTGSDDITPTSANPLTVVDRLVNLSQPSGGYGILFNGDPCDVSNGCSYVVGSDQITFTITQGTLKKTNGFWKIEFNAVLAVPGNNQAGQYYARDEGLITYGPISKSYNTGLIPFRKNLSGPPDKNEITP